MFYFYFKFAHMVYKMDLGRCNYSILKFKILPLIVNCIVYFNVLGPFRSVKL